MKNKPSSPNSWNLAVVVAMAAFIFGFSAQAGVIAYNFSENPGNQVLDTTTPKGPTATAIWNDSNVRDNGDLWSGDEANLVDDSGANTGASIVWNAANMWYNGSGTGTEDAKVAVGYLDDGGSGVSVTVSDIPYANYHVFGIVGSDQGGYGTNATYTSLDFDVNGTWALGGGSAATATAFGGLNAAEAVGDTWVQLTTSQIGNYWLVENVTGSTLTITGQARNGTERGSLAAIVIQQVPEPSTGLLGLLGLGALLYRRRS